MTQSLVQGKVFYCRDWALRKLQHCLDTCASGRNTGVLLTGGPGSGKTALCTEVLWPLSEQGQRLELSGRVLAHHFCQAQDVGTLSISGFVLSLVQQIERCPLLQGYRERLQESSVQAALQPSECERNPEEAFKRAVLLPLLDLDPPAQTLLLLVDSIDEGESCRDPECKPSGPSLSIAELLANQHELFPSWLLVVCSVRKENKAVSRMFTGFRRLCLDDLRKPHTVQDVQQYILSRLDREAALRRHLSRETAEMLNLLHIKSTGCFLYLERVLDGVRDGRVALREIRHIPGTLHGLYLWMCQRLFSRKLFAKVQPLLNALLAARSPLSLPQLYRAVWSRCRSLSQADFQRRLQAVAPLLRPGPHDTRLLFHHSFAEWLLDVKHCTQRYLCSAAQGHALLAMGLSLQAGRLRPAQVQELARHLVHSRLLPEPWGLALWMVWCGAPLGGETPPAGAPPLEQEVLQVLLKAGASAGEQQRPDSAALVHGAPEREGSVRALLESGASVQRRDSRGRTPLARAALGGSLDAVKLLLARDAELEAEDEQGQTPLTLAARLGHAEVVQCLLAHGARLQHADRRGWTALRSAAWGGHPAAVHALLAAGGADVDAADADGRTALRAAARGGHDEIVLALLRRGAGVDREDRDGRTPLIAAAAAGHRDTAEILLRHGAGVNHRDRDGRSALSVAALCVPAGRGDAGVVALLLEAGADVGQRDRDGLSPLLLAALEGRADVVALLLEAGADVNEAAPAGRTPLLAAASLGHAAAVRTLLEWGAAVDSLDGEGRTALGAAAAHGRPAAVRALLERGLDENHRDDLGWTPLHAACFEGHGAVCRALLEHGARVGERDHDGRVPALLAAQEGHVHCLRLLLERGSPLEARGADGRTCLCAAALEGHGEAARLLLSRGASAEVVDADGRPLLYLLALEPRRDMVRLLLEAGPPDLEARDAAGRTALHVCSWQGDLELVGLLLEAGAQVNALDHERRSALHSAAWQGHAAVLRALLDAGAPVEQACRQGATALGIAAQEGHAEVVRILLEEGADAHHADQYGRTPMKVAARRGQTQVMALLQRFGAPPFNGPLAPAAASRRSPSPGAPDPTGEQRESPPSTLAASASPSLSTAPVDGLSFAQQHAPGSTLPRAPAAPPHASPHREAPGSPRLSQANSPTPVERRPAPQDRRNGTPSCGNGGPKTSPRKLCGAGPLIAITSLDPELNLKQAIKLQFEGPTSGFSCKKETPL
ncbi:ankyrin repeat domain-containing protein 50-like [Narcine bancroftii]|uniref:ankyrin repeat domain-containing protein 50-like n=1 Tax=Narcine bancroftii TaxID=1343680 RepID=UPI0038322257